MNRHAKLGVASLAAALAVTAAAPASAADIAAPLVNEEASFAVSEFGEVSLAGVYSDDALMFAYNLTAADVEVLSLRDVNIGDCRETNTNCGDSCGGTVPDIVS